jgi:hypothetical protein
MDQRVTDALTEAAAAWVTLALQRLDERHLEAATACLEEDGADLQVAVRLCRMLFTWKAQLRVPASVLHSIARKLLHCALERHLRHLSDTKH